MSTTSYTRVQATDLKPGDRIVLFEELTGDPRVVTLGDRKTYGGSKQYWEFYTDTDDRLGFEPGMEVMRCE
jgi:intein/homing endonuclease